LYLITVDLLGNLLSDSENLGPQTTQYFMDFPTVRTLLYFHPMYVRNLFHCSPRTPQKLGFFQYFCNSEISLVNPSFYLKLVTLDVSMSTYNKTYTIIDIQCAQ
jgi:hypothetical protein